MANPIAKRPYLDLALFKHYPTRAEWEKDHPGQVCPPPDYSRPPKHWEDPDALKSPRRTVIYENVLATNVNGDPLMGEDGKPFFDLLVLPKEQAATVNIYHGFANEAPNQAEPVPMPLRDLEPTEYLDWGEKLMEGVVVRDARAELDRPAEFTNAIAAAIFEIRDGIRELLKK